MARVFLLPLMPLRFAKALNRNYDADRRFIPTLRLSGKRSCNVIAVFEWSEPSEYQIQDHFQAAYMCEKLYLELSLKKKNHVD